MLPRSCATGPAKGTSSAYTKQMRVRGKRNSANRRNAAGDQSIVERSVAIPKKLKKPTTSVTVVNMIDDDCAGS
jgi:hypothetical protein